MTYSKIPFVFLLLIFLAFHSTFYGQNATPVASKNPNSTQDIKEVDYEILDLIRQKKLLEEQRINFKPLEDLDCEALTGYFQNNALFERIEYEISIKEFARVQHKGMSGTALSVKEYSTKLSALDQKIASYSFEIQRLKCVRKNIIEKWDNAEAEDNYSLKEIFRRELAVDNDVLNKQRDLLESLKKAYLEKSKLLYGKMKFQILAEVERVKYEQATVKAYLTENALREWRFKAGGSEKFQKQINLAETRLGDFKKQAFDTKINYIQLIAQIESNPKWQDDLSKYHFQEIFKKSTSSFLPEEMKKQSPSLAKLVKLIDLRYDEGKLFAEKEFTLNNTKYKIKQSNNGEIIRMRNNIILSEEDFLLETTSNLASNLDKFHEVEHRRVWFYFEEIIK